MPFTTLRTRETLALATYERQLLCGGALLLALALCGPAVVLPAGSHAFADQRALAGLPHAADVLSNLAFLVLGIQGLATLWRTPRPARGQAARDWPEGLLALFFGGLVVTSIASGWYHLAPDDGRLVGDRLGMSIAFAGFIGLAVADRVSLRAAKAAALTILLAGPVTVWGISRTGNALPWGVLQFGGMALVLLLACRAPVAGGMRLPLTAALACYALAKLLEMGDQMVFEWTLGWVSGHSLKHLAAAAAALPILWAMRAAAKRRHNRPGRLSGPGHAGGALAR